MEDWEIDFQWQCIKTESDRIGLIACETLITLSRHTKTLADSIGGPNPGLPGAHTIIRRDAVTPRTTTSVMLIGSAKGPRRRGSSGRTGTGPRGGGIHLLALLSLAAWPVSAQNVHPQDCSALKEILGELGWNYKILGVGNGPIGTFTTCTGCNFNVMSPNITANPLPDVQCGNVTNDNGDDPVFGITSISISRPPIALPGWPAKLLQGGGGPATFRYLQNLSCTDKCLNGESNAILSDVGRLPNNLQFLDISNNTFLGSNGLWPSCDGCSIVTLVEYNMNLCCPNLVKLDLTCFGSTSQCTAAVDNPTNNATLAPPPISTDVATSSVAGVINSIPTTPVASNAASDSNSSSSASPAVPASTFAIIGSVGAVLVLLVVVASLGYYTRRRAAKDSREFSQRAWGADGGADLHSRELARKRIDELERNRRGLVDEDVLEEEDEAGTTFVPEPLGADAAFAVSMASGGGISGPPPPPGSVMHPHGPDPFANPVTPAVGPNGQPHPVVLIPPAPFGPPPGMGGLGGPPRPLVGMGPMGRPGMNGRLVRQIGPSPLGPGRLLATGSMPQPPPMIPLKQPPPSRALQAPPTAVAAGAGDAGRREVAPTITVSQHLDVIEEESERSDTSSDTGSLWRNAASGASDK
ncbi:hypothetical protein HK101_004235 [Irineochytrium annulatum]|nr:hypothetical protein HK101_004235 [Irineochytrium annulatum]